MAKSDTRSRTFHDLMKKCLWRTPESRTTFMHRGECCKLLWDGWPAGPSATKCLGGKWRGLPCEAGGHDGNYQVNWYVLGTYNASTQAVLA